MEILYFLLDLLVEIVPELVVSLFVEGAVEVGGHKLKKARKKKYAAKVALARAAGDPDPEEPEPFGWVKSVILYASLGLVFGTVSLVFFPNSFIKAANVRLAYLFLAPVIAGMAMSLAGRIRDKNGEEPIRLDNFFYGFLFAFAMAFLRYYVAV